MDIIVGEIWVDIPEHKGCQVSNLGRIAKPNKNGSKYIAKQSKNSDGDSVVKLGKKVITVKSIVARLFLSGVVGDKRSIIHLNNDKSDNSADNLKYVSRKEAMINMYLNGGKLKKFYIKDIDRIMDAIERGDKQDDIARKFKISTSYVSMLGSSRFDWYRDINKDKKVKFDVGVDNDNKIQYTYDMDEEWRDVPGWDGFKVSSYGRVIRPSGQFADYSGQLESEKSITISIKMRSTPIPKRLLLHRLVAMAFRDAPETGGEVVHVDGNRKNNHVANLRFGYGEDAKIEKKDLGGKKLLDADDVRAIREKIASGIILQDIADEYGVSRGTISGIKHRRIHRNVK